MGIAARLLFALRWVSLALAGVCLLAEDAAEAAGGGYLLTRHYGWERMGNQLVSLMKGSLLARRRGMRFVLTTVPRTKAVADYDGGPSVSNGSSLVGDFFDLDLWRQAPGMQSVLTMSEFHANGGASQLRTLNATEFAVFHEEYPTMLGIGDKRKFTIIPAQQIRAWPDCPPLRGSTVAAAGSSVTFGDKLFYYTCLALEAEMDDFYRYVRPVSMYFGIIRSAFERHRELGNPPLLVLHLRDLSDNRLHRSDAQMDHYSSQVLHYLSIARETVGEERFARAHVYTAFSSDARSISRLVVTLRQRVEREFGSSLKFLSCADIYDCGNSVPEALLEDEPNLRFKRLRTPLGIAAMEMAVALDADYFLGCSRSRFSLAVYRHRQTQFNTRWISDALVQGFDPVK